MTAIEGRAFLDELQYVPPEVLEELKSREHPPLGPPGILDSKWTLRMIEWPGCTYYVIWLGNGVVGGVLFATHPEKHPEENFWRIFIEPMYQDRGIGQEVFRRIYRTHPDVKRWRLGTPEFNPKTRHFYERMGFTLIGIFDREGVWFRSAEYENMLSHEERLKL
ncbi:MAG: GNAT family N-acetyltransferase [Candidatus Bipolaricaulota bacterium]|nr:MAG: GNAT family N-acetyltransferase [Candidatus Bipolaricaulota bacterium]